MAELDVISTKKTLIVVADGNQGFMICNKSDRWSTYNVLAEIQTSQSKANGLGFQIKLGVTAFYRHCCSAGKFNQFGIGNGGNKVADKMVICASIQKCSLLWLENCQQPVLMQNISKITKLQLMTSFPEKMYMFLCQWSHTECFL